jgi:hypothetical protein
MARARRFLIVAALAAGLLACADDGDTGDSTATTASGSTSTAAPPSDTPTSAETTTTGSSPAGDIVLRGDGLGVAELGDGPEEAVAAVTAALGAATADTGWEPSFSEYGTCPGELIRGVEWDHLVLLFTDGETTYGTGPHLFSWRVTGSPPALGTANGFGYQATAADAEELYPGAVELVPAAEPFPAFLQIAADGGTITAYLDDTDTVTNLEAGVACGE